jgi:Glyoxalase-like domain
MLDCPDAKQLSHFYSELLGKPITYEAEGIAMIGEEGRQPVMFQQVADYRPVRWADPAHPQQVHLDITVDDIESGEKAALAIGATRLPGQGDNWRGLCGPGGQAVLPPLERLTDHCPGRTVRFLVGSWCFSTW